MKNLTWVDETRIGVMGTNYGGFLALLTDRWVDVVYKLPFFLTFPQQDPGITWNHAQPGSL